MGASFGRDQIAQARYGYERVTYTWGPGTLGTGLTPVFDVSGWNPTDDPAQKAVVLEAIAVTQNPAVQLIWTYDGSSSNVAQGWTDAFPAGLRPYTLHAQAVSRISLAVNNVSGSAITGFQLNYTVSVRLLTVAEKLLYGYPLSPADLDALKTLPPVDGQDGLQQVQALVAKGTLPIDFRSRTYDALFANRRLPDLGVAVPQHLTIPTGGSSATQAIPVARGQYGLLVAMGVEGQPTVTLSIDRDSDLGYWQFNGAAVAAADDAPLNAFIPFKERLVINVLGSPGTYAIRPYVLSLAPSDLLTLHLRLSTTPRANYAKVVVGLQ